MLKVNNFYDGLIAFLNHFIPFSVKSIFICAPIANELLDLLQVFKPELDPMTLILDWLTNDDGSNPSKKCKLDLILRL